MDQVVLLGLAPSDPQDSPLLWEEPVQAVHRVGIWVSANKRSKDEALGMQSQMGRRAFLAGCAACSQRKRETEAPTITSSLALDKGKGNITTSTIIKTRDRVKVRWILWVKVRVLTMEVRICRRP